MRVLSLVVIVVFFLMFTAKRVEVTKYHKNVAYTTKHRVILDYYDENNVRVLNWYTDHIVSDLTYNAISKSECVLYTRDIKYKILGIVIYDTVYINCEEGRV